jgi:glycosyltransferase involved in cell wall biosynthesis
MLISIVYVTKRPGGYDILFNCLKNQVYQNYELIIVDDVLDERKDKILEYAKELGIKLKITTKSKKKTFADTKFGIANALNTGYMLSKGHLVLTLMDYAWIPDGLLQSIYNFYSQFKNKNNLLAFRERFYQTKDVVMEKLLDNSQLSIFKEYMVEDPEKMDLDICINTKPSVNENVLYDETKYWELFCACLPRKVLVQLNGLDEKLDYGDDFHEKNISYRSRMAGSKVFIDTKNIVLQLEHRNLLKEQNYTWNRFAKDTNIPVGNKLIKESGVRVNHNNFNLKL